MKRTIVTAKFDAVSLEGEQVTLKIAIGAPQPDPKSTSGDYRCKVKLAGLGDKTFIHGIDALQALSLALKFVESELRAFSDAGWHFYLPGSARRYRRLLFSRDLTSPPVVKLLSERRNRSPGIDNFRFCGQKA
ncbi:hypothetical protein LMBIIBHN_03792 [Aeromonas salmonicida]